MNKGFIALDAEVVYYYFSSLSYVNFNKLVILGYQRTDRVYVCVNVQNVAVSNLN